MTEKKYQKLVEYLTENKQTIATMESCTGGAIVNTITNIEGASNVLSFSAVTYSNEFKIKMGVEKTIIDKYTVYSIETAQAMSKAISDFAKADYGIGVTGKLNRVDEHNLYGQDNIVYISIYNRDDQEFINKELVVSKKSRAENKNDIIDNVIQMFEKILNI